MKNTYGTRTFQIALDQDWAAQERPPEGGLTFVNANAGLRLYVTGGLINTDGRDFMKTAAEMNAHALGSLAKDVERAGGTLQRDVPAIANSPDGYQVEVTAAVSGAPEVQEQMVLVTLVRPWVWALLRLSSKTLPRQELQKRWQALRTDLILVEATRK